MAEDSRPEQESGALPRRTPGTAGLTHGQFRRASLPDRLAPSGNRSPTPEDISGQAGPPQAGSAGRAAPTGPRVQPAGPLPRRSPGASAIHTPPRVRPPRIPLEPGQLAAGNASSSPAPPVPVVPAPRVPAPASGLS